MDVCPHIECKVLISFSMWNSRPNRPSTPTVSIVRRTMFNAALFGTGRTVKYLTNESDVSLFSRRVGHVKSNRRPVAQSNVR